MEVRTNTRLEPERPGDGTGRELIDLLTRAEQKAKAMAFEDIEKCLRLAIHLVKLKNGIE